MLVLAPLDYGIVSPNTLVGLMLGASVVFLFSGLAINAVTRAAGAIVFEVRRQFREIPGIMEGTSEAGVRQGRRHLHPRLAARAGHAGSAGRARPDRGRLRPRRRAAGRLPGRRHRHRHPDGRLPGQLRRRRGTTRRRSSRTATTAARARTAHAATVIGDTVGDPFKDTAGPAINPLIKVMNLVAVLIAPAIVSLTRRHQRQRAAIRYGIALVAVIVIVGAVAVSKSRSISFGDDDGQPEPAAEPEAANV